MEVYLMITITSREKLPGFLSFYDKKLPVGFVLLGYGTAKDEILDMLGLDRSEKAVCLNVVTDAFGVVTMVAMTPLVTIQLLGVMYMVKARRAPKTSVSQSTLEDFGDYDIIEL